MLKRKAQIWDRMEFLSKSHNNYHMYCILDIEGSIDEGLLKNAIEKSFSVFPILNSRFEVGFWTPCWVEEDIPEYNSFISVVYTENVEDEKKKFYQDEIDELKPCQIKAKIIRTKASDVLCIAMNHMVCDAAGFKEYLYVLCDIYSNLERNENYLPGYVLDGNRSAVGFYFDFIKKQQSIKKKLEILLKPQSHNEYKARIPLSDGGDAESDIITRSIDEDRFIQIKSYGKERGATINDMFLAAFYITVKDYLKKQTGDVKIPCMIDLRRFEKREKFDALYNLTSTLAVSIKNSESDSFDDVLKKISGEMVDMISDFKALNGYLYMIGIFELMPSMACHKLIDKLFGNFPIAYSNLGIIDDSKLRFGSLNVTDCFMTGSIKKKPNFWLAFSTFKNKVTLSVNLDGNEEDFKLINNFLEDMLSILPK